ncbi:MAG: ABC transporter ATP-binding protein [Candidatus Kapaibacterium sp.]
MLKAENINKSYSNRAGKTTEVLRSLSLEITRGEFVAIVGPSGVGKSTLLHILGTIDRPDSGRIAIRLNGDEQDYAQFSREDTARFRNRNIGFIFQFHHLLPEFDALENVMIPALIAGISKKDARAKALELLDLVGVADRAGNKPSELSGGEQQRVAIARAVINDPAVALADEPTGNLDSASSDQAMRLIADMQSRLGLTFIVATHSRDVASAADRILTMKDGAII